MLLYRFAVVFSITYDWLRNYIQKLNVTLTGKKRNVNVVLNTMINLILLKFLQHAFSITNLLLDNGKLLFILMFFSP